MITELARAGQHAKSSGCPWVCSASTHTRVQACTHTASLSGPTQGLLYQQWSVGQQDTMYSTGAVKRFCLFLHHKSSSTAVRLDLQHIEQMCRARKNTVCDSSPGEIPSRPWTGQLKGLMFLRRRPALCSTVASHRPRAMLRGAQPGVHSPLCVREEETWRWGHPMWRLMVVLHPYEGKWPGHSVAQHRTTNSRFQGCSPASSPKA